MKCNKTLYYLLSIVLTLIIGIGIGFVTGESTARENKEPLRLSVTVDEEIGFRLILSEELGNNYDTISYTNLSEVTIDINDRTLPLENAIRDGLVTVEEIIAQAKEDARNRVCIEKYKSTLGVTEFTYTYLGQYDLRIIYDVFECSDGKEHVIKDFTVTPPSKGNNLSYGFGYQNEDGEYVNLLYEDWGLEFTVAENSSTNITLNYTKAAGMESGELFVKWYHIADQNKGPLNMEVTPEINPVTLEHNTESGQMTLNWEEFYGHLPQGHYYLILYVYDHYNPTKIHPLIKNYCDGQYYTIPFSVS